MNNLHLVGFMQQSGTPLSSTDDVLIDLDRDLLWLQTQSGDEFRERYVFIYLPRFTV
jgi:hypothetical protein